MQTRQKNKSGNLPIAYKCGVAYFCELPFFVNRHTLIPRFDTEILVETVILNANDGGFSVLDLCTGSGCIAVVLAKHDFDVTAVDISRKALRVAKRNAKLNDVKINFVRANLFETDIISNKFPSLEGWRRSRRGGLKSGTVRFHAIVCNPPYIKTADIGKHDKSILHEPRIALDGGADGLDFYRRIIADAPRYLNDGGQIFLEISHEQSDDIKTILQNNGFCDIKIVKDIQGLSRVVHARKNSGT